MAAANVLFLPWLRAGFAARLADADTLLPGQAAPGMLKVRLDAGAGANNPEMTVRLRGPGDVIGIDPRQVVRTEPAIGSQGFEALDFAAIEFDNPDLPWMFTPLAADAAGRLRPWMCLVVVRQQPGVQLQPGAGSALPVLQIGAPARPADELPDLAESWAWAHAQVAWPGDAAPDEQGLRQLLATRPELSVSRLLSPRRLAAHTDYLACVVPAFEAGRLAGLDLPPAGDTLAPAWTLVPEATDPVRLPVYFQWAFRTGAREDFESIVDRLAPRDLSGGVGQRPMHIGQPGFGFAAPAAGTQPLPLEGALQPVGMARPALEAAAGGAWQVQLQRIVNRGAAPADASPGADALVGPPIYGRWLAGRHGVQTTGDVTWLDEVNLDPRERVAAGLGTRVIQAEQDDLMAQAWQQAGELAQLNRQQRQWQLAATVGLQLHQRHVVPLGRGAAGQDDMLWRLAAPAQARLSIGSDPATGQPASMQAQLARTDVGAAALAAPLRRLMRSRGPLARRVALLARKQGTLSAQAALPALGQVFMSVMRPRGVARAVPQASGMVSMDDVSQRLGGADASLLWAGLTAAAVNGRLRQNPDFEILAETVRPQFVLRAAARLRIPGDDPPIDPDIDPTPDPTPPPIPKFDSADAKVFRAAAARHLALVNPTLTLPVRPARVVLGELLVQQRATLQQQLDPLPALRLRARASVQLADGSALDASGAPLGLVPRFALPASEALARLSQDWLLPGLDKVPADTVALLQTNDRFIESFMLGLNVEMTREFVWRDFPLAHERGTWFQRFWRAARPDAPPDIAPIDQWGTSRLGSHAVTAPGAPPRRPLVLLLRSALLQRYPGTAVYAVKGVLDNGRRKPPEGVPEEQATPLFRGTLPPDTSFFGFDLDPLQAVGHPGWYFVLQQQPTEPRFGFDEDVDFGDATHVSVHRRPVAADWPAALPWAAHAAELAHRARQQPVRVMIHASELLPQLAPPLPSPAPTAAPTPAPTPSPRPTPAPSPQPTLRPTLAPTVRPTLSPTLRPTFAPIAPPILAPTVKIKSAPRKPAAKRAARPKKGKG